MLRLALVGLLLAPACAVSGSDDGTATAAELTAAPSGPISVLATGTWYRKVGCPSPDPSTCWTEGNFWIDLAIRNDAYDKRVGIVWIDTLRHDTADAWNVAAAHYEGALDGGYERWGIDATSGVFGGNEPKPQVRFAAYVEMAGTTAWDNDGGDDHRIAP